VGGRQLNNNQIKRHTAMEYKRRVCKAMNFVSHHLDRDLTLGEIAEVACFSKFHFHRIFKAVVGETIAGFTRRLRLECAANCLLANSHEDITTIAINNGFSSSQNFATAFRQHFGMTPSEFRKSKIRNTDSNNQNALILQTSHTVDTIPISILAFP
jgi:AraC family transcriptional regulator